MIITANTSYEVSVQLLRILWSVDYRNAYHRKGIIAKEYVYFDPMHCRFYFSDKQLSAKRKELIKMYLTVDAAEAIHITATKYPFYRIILGAVAYRKMFAYREYFELVRKKPEWFN